MEKSINVLIIASAENRRMKSQDEDDDIPDLIDENGNICNDHTSELDNNKETYFKIISSLFDNDDIIKYTTIDPSFYSDIKIKEFDDPNYLGHLDILLSEIDIQKYKKSFDCIFVANAYNDMFNSENILIMNQLLKDNSYLITTYPNGYSELILSNYRHLLTDNKFNIFFI